MRNRLPVSTANSRLWAVETAPHTTERTASRVGSGQHQEQVRVVASDDGRANVQTLGRLRGSVARAQWADARRRGDGPERQNSVDGDQGTGANRLGDSNDLPGPRPSAGRGGEAGRGQ